MVLLLCVCCYLYNKAARCLDRTVRYKNSVPLYNDLCFVFLDYIVVNKQGLLFAD